MTSDMKAANLKYELEQMRETLLSERAEREELHKENLRLQHELEVRTAQDGDTIRELRAQIRELEYHRDGGQGWVRT